MRKLKSKAEAVASLTGHGICLVIALVAGKFADHLYGIEVAIIGPNAPAGHHGLDILLGLGTLTCCLAGLAYAAFGTYRAARFLKSTGVN